MNAADLLVLAERCEQATGPDREIDGAIDRLFNVRPKDGDYDASERAIWQVSDGYSGLLVRGAGFARDSFCADNYTASLDAAMTLVPEGWDWATGTACDGQGGHAFMRRVGQFGKRAEIAVDGATPALALTAAALRAHAAIASKTEGR